MSTCATCQRSFEERECRVCTPQLVIDRKELTKRIEEDRRKRHRNDSKHPAPRDIEYWDQFLDIEEEAFGALERELEERR